MNCKHEVTREIRTRCFVGPVSRDENRAAHGCVTIDEECAACGAERSSNVNGRHQEIGEWGASRAERLAEARDGLRRLEGQPITVPAPRRIVHSDGRAVVASVDPADGMLVLTPEFDAGLTVQDERRICKALPAEWVSAASAVRDTVLRVSAARARIAEIGGAL